MASGLDTQRWWVVNAVGLVLAVLSLGQGVRATTPAKRLSSSWQARPSDPDSDRKTPDDRGHRGSSMRAGWEGVAGPRASRAKGLAHEPHGHGIPVVLAGRCPQRTLDSQHEPRDDNSGEEQYADQQDDADRRNGAVDHE